MAHFQETQVKEHSYKPVPAHSGHETLNPVADAAILTPIEVNQRHSQRINVVAIINAAEKCGVLSADTPPEVLDDVGVVRTYFDKMYGQKSINFESISDDDLVQVPSKITFAALWGEFAFAEHLITDELYNHWRKIPEPPASLDNHAKLEFIQEHEERRDDTFCQHFFQTIQQEALGLRAINTAFQEGLISEIEMAELEGVPSMTTRHNQFEVFAENLKTLKDLIAEVRATPSAVLAAGEIERIGVERSFVKFWRSRDAIRTYLNLQSPDFVDFSEKYNVEVPKPDPCKPK